MELLILNEKFQTQCIVDSFESLIWTDRYNAPGDFEIYMPTNPNVMPYLKTEYYMWQKDSKRLMIVEDILIETDAELGPHVTATGRSLESILDRRVVAYRTNLNGNLQNGIKRLFDDNIINPRESERRISKIRFIYSSDPRITKLTCEVNFLGETILEAVEGLCRENDLGFQMIYNEELDTFDFSLFFGEDRSYAQEKNPWVVFSPQYENLLDSRYYESMRELKTAAVIAGDENYERGQEVVDYEGLPEYDGMYRREMFVDASSVALPEATVNEESIRERLEKRGKEEYEIQAEIERQKAEALARSTAEYRRELTALGRKELIRTYITESFEGTIEAVRQYVYGKDFFIGDVVQVRDEYGKEASSRITEIVYSHDLTGYVVTPTFTTLIGGANKHPD